MLSVGLDYHPDSVRVCVLDPAGKVLLNKDCDNDWKQIDRLVRRHGTVARASIEACCGAADLAEELMHGAHWPIVLSHPGLVRRMKQSPDKHDRGDAHIGADLVRLGYLPTVWLAPAPVRELRRLVRFRQQLADRRRDIKLRIGAILRELRLTSSHTRWSKPWMRWVAAAAAVEVEPSTRFILDQHLMELEQIQARIALTEQRLEDQTRDDPVVRRLLGQPGIGPVTAWVIRAEVGRFDRFARAKQLCRFCGLTPCNASSGKRQGDSGLVHAGNPMLKSILIEAAHRLARHEPRWRALYRRLRAQGKVACVALAAVANRWMRTLFHQMKTLEPAATTTTTTTAATAATTTTTTTTN
jgi:transposase